MVRILKWLMVLSQDKSVLVTLQDVVIGKPKSKWGIAVNTLCTIFTAHHILKDLSATAAVTKVKEICIYLIWPAVHISTKQSLNRSMRLFSGHYCFFHYKVTQKTGVRSKFVPQYNLSLKAKRWCHSPLFSYCMIPTPKEEINFSIEIRTFYIWWACVLLSWHPVRKKCIM